MLAIYFALTLGLCGIISKLAGYLLIVRESSGAR